jgi:hypothetical protein
MLYGKRRIEVTLIVFDVLAIDGATSRTAHTRSAGSSSKT